jgi:energy-coupling factor transport system permease protein
MPDAIRLDARSLITTAGGSLDVSLASVRQRRPRPSAHPIAWWVWAIGLAIVATHTSHALASGLLIGVIILVVVSCRVDSPWGRVFPIYLVLAAMIVTIRVVFYVLVGLKSGGDVILALPRIPLPGWAGGIELLGPVSLSGLGSAASAGLALAALILCFGAAIALTDPRRALRSLPASLHLLGTAAVVAVTLSPQIIESWQRVQRAQRLRGLRLRGARAIVATSVPVLEDALDRSLALAASMNSRGYAQGNRGRSAAVSVMMFSALLAIALGIYALLDGSTPPWLGPALLGAAGAVAIAGSVIASARLRRSRYRPDPWTLQSTIVAASGVSAALIAILGNPQLSVVSLIFLLCCAIGALPIITAVTPR